MSRNVDFSRPIEWKSNKVASPGIPTHFIGVGESPKYALNKDTRFNVALDPENLPEHIKPTAIHEEVHPDDLDKEPLNQRVTLYAQVFETGYVGDGSYARVENVHVRELRQQRLKKRKVEREAMTDNEAWGAF